MKIHAIQISWNGLSQKSWQYDKSSISNVLEKGIHGVFTVGFPLLHSPEDLGGLAL